MQRAGVPRSRRARPFLFGGLLAASALAQTAVAEDGLMPDLSQPTVAAETWLRLKGDTAGRVTYEWMRGTATGITDDTEARPLFEIESVTLRQVRPIDRGWEERTFACRLYRDSESGGYIDGFINPYTDQYVELAGGAVTMVRAEIRRQVDHPQRHAWRELGAAGRQLHGLGGFLAANVRKFAQTYSYRQNSRSSFLGNNFLVIGRGCF